MKIMHRDQFKTMKWPNGLGVAHEIFAIEQNSRPLWRLSLAEVVGNCTFSRFAGMIRSTTVVSGAGMDLSGSDQAIQLRPLQPTTFSGELPLTGQLLDGPVENLNMVYDATRVGMAARVQTGTTGITPGDVVFVVNGEIDANGTRVTNHGAVLVSDTLHGDAQLVIFSRSISPLEKLKPGKL